MRLQILASTLMCLCAGCLSTPDLGPDARPPADVGIDASPVVDLGPDAAPRDLSVDDAEMPDLDAAIPDAELADGALPDQFIVDAAGPPPRLPGPCSVSVRNTAGEGISRTDFQYEGAALTGQLTEYATGNRQVVLFETEDGQPQVARIYDDYTGEAWPPLSGAREYFYLEDSHRIEHRTADGQPLHTEVWWVDRWGDRLRGERRWPNGGVFERVDVIRGGQHGLPAILDHYPVDPDGRPGFDDLAQLTPQTRLEYQRDEMGNITGSVTFERRGAGMVQIRSSEYHHICWREGGPERSPIRERCNGFDDDLDLIVDEDWVTPPCFISMGVCRAEGRLFCLNGEAECVGTPAQRPMPETCNGLDDDCDGVTDETADGVDPSCVGPDGCPGELTCRGGSTTCQTRGSHPEICDGVDNDCDGLTDEGVSNRCGLCGEVPAEICGNHEDDDCDGQADEVAACGCPPGREIGGGLAQVCPGRLPLCHVTYAGQHRSCVEVCAEFGGDCAAGIPEFVACGQVVIGACLARGDEMSCTCELPER